MLVPNALPNLTSIRLSRVQPKSGCLRGLIQTPGEERESRLGVRWQHLVVGREHERDRQHHKDHRHQGVADQAAVRTSVTSTSPRMMPIACGADIQPDTKPRWPTGTWSEIVAVSAAVMMQKPSSATAQPSRCP